MTTAASSCAEENVLRQAPPRAERKRIFRGIHGVVAKRLLVAWLLLSLGVGGVMTYFEMRKIDAMINHNTCEVFFDNLEVPAENLIGVEGQGFKYIVDSMNAERILIASESVGDARFFIRRATDYAKERVVFGAPIGKNQGVAFPIARAYAEAEAATLMVRKACAMFEAQQPCGAEANVGKMLASEAAWKAGEACMQTFGGFAYAREYGIERKWREARLYQTAPISTNMVLAFVGQNILGLPRSY